MSPEPVTIQHPTSAVRDAGTGFPSKPPDTAKDSPPVDTPQQPAYPMYQLTTFELRDYRKQLEHAVKRLGSAPVVQDLQQKLRQVLDEEDSRARFRAGNGQ